MLGLGSRFETANSSFTGTTTYMAAYCVTPPFRIWQALSLPILSLMIKSQPRTTRRQARNANPGLATRSIKMPPLSPSR